MIHTQDHAGVCIGHGYRAKVYGDKQNVAICYKISKRVSDSALQREIDSAMKREARVYAYLLAMDVEHEDKNSGTFTNYKDLHTALQIVKRPRLMFILRRMDTTLWNWICTRTRSLQDWNTALGQCIQHINALCKLQIYHGDLGLSNIGVLEKTLTESTTGLSVSFLDYGEARLMRDKHVSSAIRHAFHTGRDLIQLFHHLYMLPVRALMLWSTGTGSSSRVSVRHFLYSLYTRIRESKATLRSSSAAVSEYSPFLSDALHLPRCTWDELVHHVGFRYENAAVVCNQTDVDIAEPTEIEIQDALIYFKVRDNNHIFEDFDRSIVQLCTVGQESYPYPPCIVEDLWPVFKTFSRYKNVTSGYKMKFCLPWHVTRAVQRAIHATQVYRDAISRDYSPTIKSL